MASAAWPEWATRVSEWPDAHNMSSNEVDDSISSSTIKILRGAVGSADRPPSFSQLATCCASLTLTGGTCPPQAPRASAPFCGSSESRLQLLIAVSKCLPAIENMSYVMALTLRIGSFRPSSGLDLNASGSATSVCRESIAGRFQSLTFHSSLSIHSAPRGVILRGCIARHLYGNARTSRNRSAQPAGRGNRNRLCCWRCLHGSSKATSHTCRTTPLRGATTSACRRARWSPRAAVTLWSEEDAALGQCV